MAGFSSRRWDRFSDLEREVGRLFEVFQPSRQQRVRVYPPLNLYETAEAYLVTAEAPGLDLASLDLSIAGETLTIRGERKRPDSVAEEAYRRQERFFGRWSRSVTLPGRVDSEAVSAHYADGILAVTLPKSRENRPRQIAVSVAGDQATEVTTS